MKILLLENDVNRITKYNPKHSSLTMIDCFLGDDNCNEKIDKFYNDNNEFNQYETIILHKNVYYGDKREDLIKKLESSLVDKNIVIFSGNTPYITYYENTLELSAETLYGNLQEYNNECKDGNWNILTLAYGQKWEVNILLNILEKINIYIEDIEDIEDFDNFETRVELLELEKIISELEYERLFLYEDDFSFEDITSIKKEINNLLERRIHE